MQSEYLLLFPTTSNRLSDKSWIPPRKNAVYLNKI